MPQLEKALRDEMRRMARRELGPTIKSFQATVRALKDEVRDLRKKLDAQAKGARSAASKETVTRALQASAAEAGTLRWRPEQLRTWRTRSGVSGQMLADLMGVSSQSVYNWELGKTRPDDDAMAKLAKLRKLGKGALREAHDGLSGRPTN